MRLCLFLTFKKIYIICCLQAVFQAQGSLKASRKGRFAHAVIRVCTLQRWTAPASQATWGTASPAAGTCCKCWCPSQRWQTSCRYGPGLARCSVGGSGAKRAPPPGHISVFALLARQIQVTTAHQRSEVEWSNSAASKSELSYYFFHCLVQRGFRFLKCIWKANAAAALT